MREQNIAFSYMEYYKKKDSENECITVSPKMILGYDDLLKGSCGIGCLTVMFDAHQLGKIDMPTQRRGQDWGYWLLLMRSAGVAKRAPGCLAVYHDHQGTLSKNKFKKFFDIYTIYRSIAHFRVAGALLATINHAYGAIFYAK